MSPGRRSLISLVVIAVALLAAAAAWRMAPPPPPPPSANLQPVFDFPPSAVRAIAVRTWQGTLRAQRGPDGWQLEEVRSAQPFADGAGPAPNATEVDQTLATLVREIVTMPEIDRFPLEAGSLRDFGLEEPQATVVLQLDSGEERALEVGQLTITTAALYARTLPSQDVLQIGTLVFNNIAAALYRLRALETPDDPP